MPFYIIRTTKGFYEGIKDGVPAFGADISYNTYICGRSLDEAQGDFEFHRDLITRSVGDVGVVLDTIRSRPLPPEKEDKPAPDITALSGAAASLQADGFIMSFKINPPPEGWRVLDYFGANLALLYDGERFAIRQADGKLVMPQKTEKANGVIISQWLILRDSKFWERTQKLFGGGTRC